MTVSALTATDVANYLHMDAEDLTASELTYLGAIISASAGYIRNYTGQTDEYLDQHPEIAIAALCLAGDMYTNRDMIDNGKGASTPPVNRTIQSILDMHRYNLLPTPEPEGDV